jgi:acetyl esterase
MQASASAFFGPVEPVPFEDRGIPSAVATVPVRVYRPVEHPAPIVVYFHGGGWVLGNVHTVHGVARLRRRDAQGA